MKTNEIHFNAVLICIFQVSATFHKVSQVRPDLWPGTRLEVWPFVCTSPALYNG
jgi:hypothetical protein